jgi:hypothetical protein
MENPIPKIKKTIKAFICEEDATTTKEAILRLGLIGAVAAISAQKTNADTGECWRQDVVRKYSTSSASAYGGSTPSTNGYGGSGADCHCNNIMTETITPPDKIEIPGKTYILVAKVDTDCHANSHGNVHSNDNYDDCGSPSSSGHQGDLDDAEIEKCNHVYHWNELSVENTGGTIKVTHAHEVPPDITIIDPELKTSPQGSMTGRDTDSANHLNCAGCD